MDSYVIIFITAKDGAEAQAIGKKLLEDRLAACVNILDGIKSFFWWEGKIDDARETLMIVKSRKELFPRIVESVKAKHSYSVPEILAFPVVAGNEDYLKWVDASTAAEHRLGE